MISLIGGFLKKIFLMAALMALFCGAAQSAVIYQEWTDGDLLGQVDPLTTFNFTVGTNTVSGATGYETPGNADFDSFAFVLPVGTTLSSASLAVNLGGGLQSVQWSFKKGSAALFGGTELEIIGDTQNFTQIPQAADTYQIYGVTMSGGQTFTGNATYVFTFDVTSDGGGAGVPEPGTLGLMGIGGAMLAYFGRRRVA